METGCPIVAREEVDVLLEFEGEGNFYFSRRLLSLLRQDLAAALSAAGTPDARYIGIKPSTRFCSSAHAGTSRRLLHAPSCTELALVVYVTDHALVEGVREAIRDRDFCAVAESTLRVSEGVKVHCGVRQVSSASVPGLSHDTQSCDWGMGVEGVFILGIFTGVVASVMITSLLWLISHKTCCGKTKGTEKKIQECKKPDGQPELKVKSTLASFNMRRNCDVNPRHIPLQEDSPSSGDGGSTQVVMVDELGMPSSRENQHEPIVMSMYFEEVLPISTALDKLPQRSGVVKTRILHKKYKVQEADLAQDGSHTDPATLLCLGSKFLFMIDIRKNKKSQAPFPFASVDHVVVVLPDGVPQMLRLVTLSSSGPNGKGGSCGSCWHRVAALWDPAQHGSRSLSKVTPDGASLSLDVTVVFRVFGTNQGMSYVKKAMSVRVREGGKALPSDAQYCGHSKGSSLPEWVRTYVKGAAVTLRPAENSGGLIVEQTS
eukprot:evm.model.scf_21EXC.15 EVM.evm.TU.scf_21EXC.15   scf_21EXC:148610-152367(-)